MMSVQNKKDPQSTESDQRGKPSTSYASRYSRLTKDNLYMIVALWMQDFPQDKEDFPEDKPEDSYRKVGAVLVLPNDKIYAVDCSRNGVHAVARLLMMHHNVLEDCKVFVSRKPCSFCTKLLVQSKVKRVFYLPIEPEYSLMKDVDFEEETLRVDNLFKVSSISQSVFVPEVGEDVIKDVQHRHQTPERTRNEMAQNLKETYWNDDWMREAKNKLPWHAFDEEMRRQVESDFTQMLTWMASILVVSEKGYNNELESSESEREPTSGNTKLKRDERFHLMTLAKFLAERTDDPKTGVGAVITNKKKEIVGLGWNGFPSKALYGEFPRASDRDDVPDKKYPYVIHAEQNALLTRNTKNIEGGTLFVTKTPCNECTALLEMLGIKTFVLGQKLEKKSKDGISYQKFPKGVESGKFTCL
ncbi:cytidine and dCMP deaminase domain-containing protein 1-like [Montipora capricornis]|uniref:cytidine and dCMP deaminase domain-containing protein 1-like n=1 Tax=Montipora capricornis TaxID=246305 RepID=UPI0035F21AC1